MGCTSSINSGSDSVQQPVKDYKTIIVRQQSKVIKFVEPPSSKQNAKKQVIHKKQQKIKQLKNNKEFIELSIETSYCVNKLLNTLAQNQMFQDHELKTLLSKNNQTLVSKKNRYKNLEAREEKMELELRKQIEKHDRGNHLRKTVPAKTKQQMIAERKNQQKGTVYHSHKLYQPYASDKENKQNKENNGNRDSIQSDKNHSSQSEYLQSNYKAKFMKKIDMFRSQVNTLVAKENMHL